MVSSHIQDALYAPNQVIESLWKASKDSTPDREISELIDDFPRIVEAHFRRIVETENGLKEICNLRTSSALGSFSERQLVRVRLMVQDNSISPEIYLGQQNSGLPGGWAMEHSVSPTAEVSNPADTVDYSKLRERHVFWAVRVPGESSWLSRLLDSDVESPAETGTTTPPASPYAYKSPNGELGLQLKFYGQAPKLSLTDVVTLVGILDHEHYVGAESHDFALAPTLHVMYWNPNPTTLLQESNLPPIEPARIDAKTDWNTLIDWIAEALGGDLDAASWVALCAVSSRHDIQSTTNSPISLALTKFPPAPTFDAVPTIVALLAELVPLVSHIPLSLEVLNTTSMAPYSEASKEDLSAGRLQLPHGSLVVFDERVEEGKLVERGVENMKTIQDVLLRQTLAYRFPYSCFDFKTNINSIVLTEGKREAVFVKASTDFCIPVHPRAGCDLYGPLPTCDRLDALRRLIFQIKTGNQSGLKGASNLTEHVQNMFARDRQAERASGGRNDGTSAADEYGLRLRLSKTMALGLGLSEVACDVFDRVVDLDKRRIQRLATDQLGAPMT